jgi:hypothetical protein
MRGHAFSPAHGSASMTWSALYLAPENEDRLGRVDGFHQHEPARETDDG